MLAAIQILCLLLFAHALADYPLQGQFLADAKNRFRPIAGYPWYQAMAAHAIIHGGFVAIITGVWWLGICAYIDDLRCANKVNVNVDQLLHVLCKLYWLAICIWVTP